jgi:excisionase family DNA binding protein
MDQALTVREVAQLLQVDEKTVYRLVRKGELPGFKVAGAWRFTRPDLQQWIERQKNATHSGLSGLTAKN